MGYMVFCLIVFTIQAIITYVDFKLARRHHALNEYTAASADILAGISWGMTACWWLYQASVASIE